MALATHQVHVDFAGDGLFEASDAITSAIDGDAGVTLISATRGRDAARLLAQPRAGTAGTEVNNQDGAYDPDEDLQPGQEFAWRSTFGGVTYWLCCGLLDVAEQLPRSGLQNRVRLAVKGQASRLVGKQVTTALYVDQPIGTLIEAVLDAAGYPKNAQAYALAQTGWAAFWGLGGAIGDESDLSGNGNDLPMTIGAGARHAAALDDDGDGSITFDNANTRGTISSPATELDDTFDAGGTLVAIVDPNSDGENSFGNIYARSDFTRHYHRLYLDGESGGASFLNFLVSFTTTAGAWRSASRVIRNGEANVIVVVYNADATTNDPTIYVWNATDGLSVLTVGSGLAETSTPVGTRRSVAGIRLDVGNDIFGNNTFDGEIDEVGVGATAWTATQAKAWISRCERARRRIDAGQTVLPWWWATSADAWQAIVRLVNTEGPGAALYEDGKGALVFKDRDAYLSESRSTTAQSTFRTAASGAEPLLSGFAYDPGRRDAITSATATVKRRSAKSLQAIWSLGETVTLTPGQSVSYEVRTTAGDPFTSAVSPLLSGTDYTVVTGSVASATLDRTSGGTATLTVTAGASGVVLTGLQVRAQPVTVDGITAVRDAHQAGDGDQSYPLPVYEEISVSDAQNFCDAIVGFYRYGRPRAVVDLEGAVSDERMTAALAREIHDRVRVIDVNTGLDADFLVHQKTLAVSAPNRLRGVLSLEAASTVHGFVTGLSELGGVDVVWF